ncbi:MAG: hypothetical protein LLF92_11765 [Planctomycetaceae bacterium]|nr:hypothetical protein [Planctomycetaceae bacterium]
MWIDLSGLELTRIFAIAIEIIKTLINNLSSILTAIAGLWVAIIATCALRTWRYQTRAEKHIQFMDELTDTVHEYIQAMSAPIEMLKYIEISIEAYIETASLKNENAKNAGVISYIENRGKDDQTRLIGYLDKVRPIISRMASLAAKGQVMGFENYGQCYDACEMLAWSYRQIEAVAMIIGNEHLNWANETVQRTLDKVITVKSDFINNNLAEHNRIFLEFVKQNYKNLLA